MQLKAHLHTKLISHKPTILLEKQNIVVLKNSQA